MLRPTPASSSARVSTSSAAACGPSRDSPSGMPGLVSTEASAARSISSTAATGVVFIAVTAMHAVRRSSNSISAAALFAWSGTVRYVIDARKPSVPSEPIIRCARTCTGSSKSTRALSP